MMTLSVINSWQRIDGWLKANAPLAWHSLNPGVSEEEIHQKEDAIGVLLPEDFKASYRIHDGCKFGYRFEHLLMGWQYFYPLKSIGGGEEGGYITTFCKTLLGPILPQPFSTTFCVLLHVSSRSIVIPDG